MEAIKESKILTLFILIAIIMLLFVGVLLDITYAETTSIDANNMSNITILTHGEIGGISIWSNSQEGTFTYNGKSLLECLRYNNNADVYILNFVSNNIELQEVKVINNSTYELCNVDNINQ